jgi:hypothetical protein
MATDEKGRETCVVVDCSHPCVLDLPYLVGVVGWRLQAATPPATQADAFGKERTAPAATYRLPRGSEEIHANYLTHIC